MKTTKQWQPISTAPEDVPVYTKIDNEMGCRNECKLILHGNLWYYTDKSMYVYYRPTHWAPISKAERIADLSGMSADFREKASAIEAKISCLDAPESEGGHE